MLCWVTLSTKRGMTPIQPWLFGALADRGLVSSNRHHVAAVGRICGAARIVGKLADLPSEGTAPYAIMVFAGMLPWTFFSSALSDASNSLLGGANLISKVYFPWSMSKAPPCKQAWRGIVGALVACAFPGVRIYNGGL